METIPPKTTSKYLRSEIAGNVFGNHVTDNMAVEGSFVLGDLYNHIGSDLKYAIYHDWRGHISNDPKYPETIENNADQPGKFKHIADELGKPKAAVVYRPAEDNPFYWVICWEVAGGVDNRAYTEIQPVGSFDDWYYYKSVLEAASTQSEFTRTVSGTTYKTVVTIGGGDTPGLTAEIEEQMTATSSK